jgi:DedD protein
MMDQKLKQRLVGAVVLISLAVIFIPVILEGPDDEWTPRVQEIPVPPQIEYQAEIELPVPEETPAPAPETTPPAAAPLPETQTADVPPQPAEQPAPPAPVQPEPVAEQAAAAPAAAAGSWVIQVGSFSQQLNASGLRDRLKKTGYNSRLQEITSGNGKAWRVLVGPFDTRAAAEKQRDRITGQHHMKGMVTQLKD